ncbi:MAG: hypothetical protein PHI83_10030 [Sphaerochaetaceae bacterium]|jgi:hypothetical protein|nr:hypothetical protein [Sphaerochaetaceae bacterium]
MKTMLASIIALMVLVSCTQAPISGIDYFSGKDNMPPKLIKAETSAADQVVLSFSEPVVSVGKPSCASSVQSRENLLIISLFSKLDTAQSLRLCGRVKDRSGNTLGYEITVYGMNSRIPGILINEFTTVSTPSNPSRTELLVTEEGNTAGLCLYDGTPQSWEKRVVLDAWDVKAGDFIVIWWTARLPDNVAPRSGNVINIACGKDEKLPSYSGVLCLARSPGSTAAILDAAVWAKASGSAYEGLGNKANLERASYLQRQGQWLGAVSAQSAIDSEKASATKPFYRTGKDTNTKADWCLGKAGSLSFGRPNP